MRGRGRKSRIKAEAEKTFSAAGAVLGVLGCVLALNSSPCPRMGHVLTFHSKAINITAAVAATPLSSLVNLSHVLVLNAGSVLFRRF